MGPVGNGKSVTCINELHRLAVLQEPNSHGIRKTRWAIIRNTYPELSTTTLKTFKQWIPEELCQITMHPLITGTLRYQLKDKTNVEAEFIFMALDKPDDVKKLLSLELTGAFINEAREIPYAVVKACRERIGRYPARIDGYEDDGEYKAPRDASGAYQPCTRKALIMDTNPTDDDHWWYQLAEDGALKGNTSIEAKNAVAEIFDFFRGVPPLTKTKDGYENNPLAENIEFLPGGYQYYRDMIAGNTEDHINVMVLGNYGSIQEGKAVYPDYNDRVHCPDEALSLISDLPVGIGWDFGLTPAAVFGQLTTTGQLRIVAELVSEDMDVRRFARDVVKPFIQRNFSGMEIGFSLADPAGNNRGEGEGKTGIGILNDDFIDNDDGDIIQPLDMGFITEPAPTNDPGKRIDAVNSFIIKMVCGDPGYLLSKRCSVLRKGKLGGYHYRRMQVTGAEARYTLKPDKNNCSHPSDAEQYLALGFVGGYVTDSSDYEDDYPEYRECGPMGY
jgi:hypothetical protein